VFIIIICVAVIVFMPIIAKFPVVFAISKQGKYDNKYPRQQQEHLEGLGARAVASHKNCFEAICYFAPTILLVIALDAHNVYTVQWSVAFVLIRCLYLGFYWANWHILRSIAWATGMATLVPHYWLLLG
jgi:uncharacterized MAPEG superfamily protein